MLPVMWSWVQALVCLLAILVSASGIQQAACAASSDEDHVKRHKQELEARFKSAVVYISTYAFDHLDIRTPNPFTGTGFIISEDGYVITADHVLPDSKRYKAVEPTKVRIGSIVNPDLQARVIQRLPEADLALIKIDAPPSDIRTVQVSQPMSIQRYETIYLAGFPGGEDFYITSGELQSVGSVKAASRWLARLDQIAGDSGGPVFFNKEVFAVAQRGYEVAEKNKYIAPIILADKLLEEAKVWRPWQGREAAIKKFEERIEAVTTSLGTTSNLELSRARTEELFVGREHLHNTDNSVREYRHKLYEVAILLNELKPYFMAQDKDKAIDALDRGETEIAKQLLIKVAVLKNGDSGKACYGLGFISEANIDYESALSWYRQALTKPDPRAVYFDTAAEIAHKLGDQKDAIEWAKESIRIREANISVEEPVFADALCHLGVIVVESDPNLTIGNCTKAYDILKRYPGQELLIAEVSDTLGAAYGFQGDFGKEEEWYRNALDISEREEALTKEVRARKIFANSNNNLAGLYRRLGRHKDSLPLRETAITVNEEVLGKEHPRLGIDLAGLAIQKRALGYYAESQVIFEKSRKMIADAFGHKNRLMGVLLKDMATLDLIYGHDQEALDRATAALGIFEQVYGKENSVFEIQTRLVLAQILSHRGKQAEGLQELIRAEKLLGSKYPARSDLALQIFLLRADALIKQDTNEGAQVALGAAQDILNKLGYRNEALSGEFEFIKGKLASKSGQWGHAEGHFENAQQLLLKSLGSEHPKRAAVLGELAKVQRMRGNATSGSSTEALASRIASKYAGTRVVTVIDL